MEPNRSIDLNIDMASIKNYQDYKALWQKIGKIEIKMVEKNEECQHNVGDTFIYESPYQKPPGVCSALLHVLDLYIWRVALGFPSWNEADFSVYKLHCPDPKGTVWEMRKIVDEAPKIIE
ncbi:MAG TPA: hypothetical protein DDW50_08200 [Firmicutes bacterium]|nr:hypothetical protein [Bacillota bacterium]